MTILKIGGAGAPRLCLGGGAGFLPSTDSSEFRNVICSYRCRAYPSAADPADAPPPLSCLVLHAEIMYCNATDRAIDVLFYLAVAVEDSVCSLWRVVDAAALTRRDVPGMMPSQELFLPRSYAFPGVIPPQELCPETGNWLARQ